MIINTPQIDYFRTTSFDKLSFDAFRWLLLDTGDYDLNTMRKSRMLNYAGIRIGKAFAGDGKQSVIENGERVNATHYMLDVAGYFPKDRFNAIYGLGTNKCTRIDLQVTIDLPKRYRARRLKDKLTEGQFRGERARQRKVGMIEGQAAPKQLKHIFDADVSLLEGYDAFDTIYIGSRSSGRYIRIYVKADIDGKRYLRFEVEFKGKLAQSTAQQLQDGATMQSILLSEINRLPESLFLRQFANQCGTDETLIRGEKVVTEDSKTIKWLAKKILPVFMRVINSHDDGSQRIVDLFQDAIDNRNARREGDNVGYATMTTETLVMEQFRGNRAGIGTPQNHVKSLRDKLRN